MSLFFFHNKAIDDYPGVVAQSSVCQGARRSYAARVPFPCHERVALARVFALAPPFLVVEVISSSATTPPTQQRGESRIVLEPHDRRTGVLDFQYFSIQKILRAGPRWYALSIKS